MAKLSDLAGSDPSYAERLHQDHVRERHCDEVEQLQSEKQHWHDAAERLNDDNERLRAELEAAYGQLTYTARTLKRVLTAPRYFPAQETP